MKIALSFLLILTLISCGPVLSVVENTNTHKKFETAESYLDFIKKRTEISSDKIIILNDGLYNTFAFEIANNKLDTYYGIVNENYFSTAAQLEDKSCPGQIEILYKMIAANSDKVVKIPKNEVEVLEKLNLNPNKNTLVFIYSYKLGGLSKNKIVDVVKELSIIDDFDYRLISLDNYDILNK